MIKFPCKNCIALPICKSRIVFTANKRYYSIAQISSKCKPFFEWWKKRDDIDDFKKLYNIPNA